MKENFDCKYIPPAPTLPVKFISAELELAVGPFPALVDTGTDVTSAPLAYLEQIQAPFARKATVIAHSGTTRTLALFLVDVQVGEWRFPGVDVIGDENSNEVILGRDVLNKLWLLFAGPEQTTEGWGTRPNRIRR